MLDETIVTEMPPITYCYTRIGTQKRIPITGDHARRIVHGALNIQTGAICLLITNLWNQVTHQDFLQVIRAQWRGWNLILFEDRGSPHTAEDSQTYARALNIQLRFLPRATPELNAMDHLWRDAKKYGLASCPTETIDQSAQALCQYIINMSPQERLQNAGILSGNFWLTK
jgi:transposase